MTYHSNVPMRPLLIGLAGQAGSGKSYLAQHLAVKHGFEVVSFADPLKLDVLEILEERYSVDILGQFQRHGGTLIRGQLLDSEPNRLRWANSPDVKQRLRTLYQGLGMAVREFVDEDYWVDRLLNKALPDRTVIDDVRFANEAKGIVRQGGYTIKVFASQETRRARLGLTQNEIDTQDDHVSEAEIVSVHTDYTVDNDGDATGSLDAIIEELTGESA